MADNNTGKSNYERISTNKEDAKILLDRANNLPFSDKLARSFTNFTGSNVALSMAALIILVWICTGPIFQYSDTWQLVINTGTTIITFLMVFIIQRAQNKDSIAIHLKLNELVASLEGASNRLIDCEDLSEKELRLLERHYRTLADRSSREDNKTIAHSIEEAQDEIQEELKDLDKGIIEKKQKKEEKEAAKREKDNRKINL